MTDLFVVPWATGQSPEAARADLVALLGTDLSSLAPIARDNILARIGLIDAHLSGAATLTPSTVYQANDATHEFTPVDFSATYPDAPAAAGGSSWLLPAAALAALALWGRRR